MRISRYRHGGGRAGNVAADALTVLRSPIPGVDTVTNPRPATGGVDAEPLEHARARASMEIRSRYRAVTAEDFEFLAGEASPRVARAVCSCRPTTAAPCRCTSCRTSTPPTASCATRSCVPDEELLREVGEYLDARRLVGTRLQLLPCRFAACRSCVNLEASPLADPGGSRRTSRTRSTRT